ncbi:unnamed protein product [Meloidogyne enterolobii]|uniref:Uncharacterized protein n=1 Tax=Meloidogyne enterolobii TaxID=390850 RepID=A0ACB1ATW5_MELEN
MILSLLSLQSGYLKTRFDCYIHSILFIIVFSTKLFSLRLYFRLILNVFIYSSLLKIALPFLHVFIKKPFLSPFLNF